MLSTCILGGILKFLLQSFDGLLVLLREYRQLLKVALDGTNGDVPVLQLFFLLYYLRVTISEMRCVQDEAPGGWTVPYFGLFGAQSGRLRRRQEKVKRRAKERKGVK